MSADDRPIRLVHTPDMHAGSKLAMCPETVPLDEGGFYHRSKPQAWLSQCWDDFWGEVHEEQRRDDARLFLGINGDLVEGDHHRTTQIITQHNAAQKYVFAKMIATPLSLNPEKIYVIRGTMAHGGQEGSSEEAIADGLLRDKRPIIGDPETGTASWWHARLRIHNTIVDLAHHGRTGTREHTERNAAVLYAHDIYLAHGKDGDPPPDLVLRGHHHRFNDSYDACPTRVATSGCWQLSTAFGHKVAPDKLCHIGGHIVTIAPKGYTLRRVQFKANRPIYDAT